MFVNNNNNNAFHIDRWAKRERKRIEREREREREKRNRNMAVLGGDSWNNNYSNSIYIKVIS